MNTDVKNFIENNITVIESKRWDDVFNLAKDYLFVSHKRELFELLTNVFPEIWYSITTVPPIHNKMEGVFSIPENITKIGPNAFEDSKLSKIIIPNTVKFIGRMAFAGCENLTDVYIPTSVQKVQEFAFSSCPILTIHYEGQEIPSTWSNKWNSRKLPVKFGDTFQ